MEENQQFESSFNRGANRAESRIQDALAELMSHRVYPANDAAHDSTALKALGFLAAEEFQFISEIQTGQPSEHHTRSGEDAADSTNREFQELLDSVKLTEAAKSCENSLRKGDFASLAKEFRELNTQQAKALCDKLNQTFGTCIAFSYSEKDQKLSLAPEVPGSSRAARVAISLDVHTGEATGLSYDGKHTFARIDTNEAIQLTKDTATCFEAANELAESVRFASGVKNPDLQRKMKREAIDVFAQRMSDPLDRMHRNGQWEALQRFQEQFNQMNKEMVQIGVLKLSETGESDVAAVSFYQVGADGSKFLIGSRLYAADYKR